MEFAGGQYFVDPSNPARAIYKKSMTSHSFFFGGGLPLRAANELDNTRRDTNPVQRVVHDFSRCFRKLLAKRSIGGSELDELGHDRACKLGVSLKSHYLSIVRDHRLVGRVSCRRKQRESFGDIMDNVLVKFLDPLKTKEFNCELISWEKSTVAAPLFRPYHAGILPELLSCLSALCQGPSQLSSRRS